jgi:CBS domain-containing membrane protein
MSPGTTPQPRLTLTAVTAADMMSPNPVSLEHDATVPEAVALLTDRGFSAAPVIDDAARPIGVLSRGDILVHEREHARRAAFGPQEGLHPAPPRHEGFSIEVVDRTRVSDIMTPAVFTVPLRTPAAKVVEQMLALNVHQLYVVDDDQLLVGVVTALDVLRHLEQAR